MNKKIEKGLGTAPYQEVPTGSTFYINSALRRKHYKRGSYEDADVFFNMVFNYITCIQEDDTIPFSLTALALFCGVTYHHLWEISKKSDAHNDTYEWVKDMIECDLEDKLTNKETYHQGIANRLKCRYPERWDRNTILAESIGENTQFNFTIE